MKLFHLLSIAVISGLLALPAFGQTSPLGLSKGGTNADLSGTGGTSQYVKQSSVGAALTVGAIGAADLPGAFSGFGNPTNPAVNITGSNGVATTAMRSDAILKLDLTISPTMTGTWVFNSGNFSVVSPGMVANGSNLITAMSKAVTRSWNWSYDTQNFGSGSSVDALKLCSDLTCSVPIWTTAYGFFNVGNMAAGYPMLSPNLSDSTGPAIRVLGDYAGGDNGLYFGSSEYPITAISNSGGLVEITYAATTNPSLVTGNKIMIAGSQTALNNGPSPAPVNWTITVIDSTHFTLNSSTFTATCASSCGYFGTGGDPQVSLLTLQGGFPSARIFSPSQRNAVYNHDWYGGATIIQCPDVDLVGLGNGISCLQGELILGAYSSAAGGGDILFQSRSGVGTVATRWTMGAPGNLFPGLDNTYSIGASGLGVKQYFASAGSASNPSITFQNDTTTGLYRSGGNQLGFTMGGVSRGTWDGNGLVLSNQLHLAVVVFSGLPTCTGKEGTVIGISDSNTGTYNATITAGSGTNHVIAYCNGTNWTAH